jgi:putative restriction endonuclease
VDGPMLRHGLQEMAGTKITIPRQRTSQPEPSRLAERYGLFLAAS